MSKKIDGSYFLNQAHLDIAKARYFLKDPKTNAPTEGDMSEVFTRVINYLHQNDHDFSADALNFRLNKQIIDGGRFLANAGTATKNLLNCFCIGFEDDSREAISDLKARFFHIQSHGGGVGVNFSTLRPRGSICKSTQSISSGTIGFITELSYQSSNISQGGNRSGATLVLLEDWHPDLLEFINFKREHNWEVLRKWASVTDEDAFSYFQWNVSHPWQTVNASVGVSDKFMEQAISNSEEPWILRWKNEEWPLWHFVSNVGPATRGQYNKDIVVSAPNIELATLKAKTFIPYNNAASLQLQKGPYHLTAKEYLALLGQAAHMDGCPGLIFLDKARVWHNGEYLHPIACSNPCGEQIVPDDSVCCLSSLILPSFADVNGKIKWNELSLAIHSAIRTLDNAIDLTHLGDSAIDARVVEERRIGLGITGLAELLLMKKLAYSSKKGLEFTKKLLSFIRDTAYTASAQLAHERGSFSGYNYNKLKKSSFFESLPESVQLVVKNYGLRNITCTTQAPAGTIGTIVGYSTGCEPYFQMIYNRNTKVGSFVDGAPTYIKWLKENNLPLVPPSQLPKGTEVPDYFEDALSISPEAHLNMLEVFANHVDSNASKTVNLPNEASIESVVDIFTSAYKKNIRSVTVYRDGSKQQILETIQEESFNRRPGNIIRSTAPKRPKELECDIHNTSILGNKWTILVGLLEGKPYEVFGAPQEAFELSSKYKKAKLVKKGKGSYCLDLEDFKINDITKLLKTDEHRVITRLLSTSLRHGVPMDYIAEQLAKAEGTVVDFSKAILKVLRKYMSEDSPGFKEYCPSCRTQITRSKSGCISCPVCGSSSCE